MAAYTDERAALSPFTLRLSPATKEALRQYAGTLSQDRGRPVTSGEAARELLEKAVEIALRDGALDVNERLLGEVALNTLFARKVLELQLETTRPRLIRRLLRLCRERVDRLRRTQ